MIVLIWHYDSTHSIKKWYKENKINQKYLENISIEFLIAKNNNSK